MLNKEIRSARLVYTRPWTLKVSCSFFYYNGVATLKKLDFGLQKPTGPSSGVVASIVLIIIALSSVSFFNFLHNSQILYFEPLLKFLKKSELFKKNHKKSKLGHKVIIFISCERSCATLCSEWLFFSNFHFIVDFCEI